MDKAEAIQFHQWEESTSIFYIQYENIYSIHVTNILNSVPLSIVYYKTMYAQDPFQLVVIDVKTIWKLHKP